MKFIETPLPGAFVIELEKRGDDRGFFARFFCQDEFAAHGLKIIGLNQVLQRLRRFLFIQRVLVDHRAQSVEVVAENGFARPQNRGLIARDCD